LQAGGHRFDPGHVHHFSRKNSDFMRSARHWRFQCHLSVTASDVYTHDSVRAAEKAERSLRFQRHGVTSRDAYGRYAQCAFEQGELGGARRNDFCHWFDFIVS
jgi:hypothetical protein